MVASTVLEPSEFDVVGEGGDGVDLLSTVAEPVRWAVLRRLAAGEACVCELRELVPVAGNLLSYHLRVLREAGLVTATRRGRWMDYQLAPGAHARLAAALPTTLEVALS
jgi:ArsR family transcriptional regulator